MTLDEIEDLVATLRGHLEGLAGGLDELRAAARARPELMLHLTVRALEQLVLDGGWCRVPAPISYQAVAALCQAAELRRPDPRAVPRAPWSDERWGYRPSGVAFRSPDEEWAVDLGLARVVEHDALVITERLILTDAGRAYLRLALRPREEAATSPSRWRVTSDNALHGPAVSALVAWLVRLVRESERPGGPDRFAKLEVE